MAVPALRHLRDAFPDSKITLHTRSWAEGIFRDADFIDEVLTFDKTGSRIGDVRTQARVLRERKFDLAVLLPNSFESALTAKLARIPRRYGYAKEGRGFLLTKAVKIPDWKNERHEVFYYLDLIEAVEKDLGAGPGTRDESRTIDLAVSDTRRKQARGLFIKHNLDPAKRTIALGVGSTNSRAKRWPAASYAELNDKLQDEMGVNVILVGGADETGVSREVYDLSARKPFIFTGQTDLAEAVAVLAEADMLISNDMGLAHIAPAVGTKTVVIFGPTNPETTRPFSANAEIMRRSDVECSPCMLRDCPIDHRCMTRITPADVLGRARMFLEER